MRAEVWIAGASFLVSVSAFWVSWRADKRGQVATRTQLFLSLRTRFLDVFEKLPAEHVDPQWDASKPGHRQAAVRYWHHAFDEWYITRLLNRRLMGVLWEQYYSAAILGGMQHNGLRKAFKVVKRRDVLWKQFGDQLISLWSANHPTDGRACIGLECDHTAEKE